MDRLGALLVITWLTVLTVATVIVYRGIKDHKH
jgi:hypothetical protein